MILNESGVGGCIRVDEERVENRVVVMQPVDTLLAPKNQFRPLLDLETDGQVGRADVGDAHEDPPEEELHGAVAQVEHA